MEDDKARMQHDLNMGQMTQYDRSDDLRPGLDWIYFEHAKWHQMFYEMQWKPVL